MALNENEHLLIESIKSFLQQDEQLGLNIHKKDKEHERGFEYLHNEINNMFELKSAELTHSTGINAAFAKIHTYKYIDDPTFKPAFDKEMTAQGIPKEDRTKAIDSIDGIIEELKTEFETWSEADFGFHPQLDEIISSTKYDQGYEFNIEKAGEGLNKANVTWDKEDFRSGRTPSTRTEAD